MGKIGVLCLVMREHRDKKRPIYGLLLGLTALLLGGCDYFEYHPYDTDIQGDRGITERQIIRIEEALEGKRSFRFAVISDTQGNYDDTQDAVQALNAHEGIDFVIHCGDLSDFGLKKEFQFQRDILAELRMPYLALIGNHDCIATGEVVYESIFGATNFAFTAGNTRFICLNTNAMEYDYTTPVPDFDFLGRELSQLPDSIERVVYAMHVRPGEFQFNNNVSAIFEHFLLQAPGLPFCLYGHEHTLRSDDLFGDGVLYYQCPDIGKRCYLLFTMHETDYDYEVFYF